MAASATVPVETILAQGLAMQTIAGLGVAKLSILTSSSNNSSHPALDLLILGMVVAAVASIVWIAVRSRNKRA